MMPWFHILAVVGFCGLALTWILMCSYEDDPDAPSPGDEAEFIRLFNLHCWLACRVVILPPGVETEVDTCRTPR